MQFNIASALNIAAKVATALTGDNDITIRHAGLVTMAPYEGNEQKTVAQLVAEYGSGAGIPAGARPSFSQSGVGAIAEDAQVQPGAIIDAYTDKKENA